ncbi:MAG: phytoene/squalene synthase family protein [Chthoniobacterales bacterium]
MSAHSSSGRPADSILRSVSRSFYLSIRILPARLREPVGLAYLLARTTDTIADTAHNSRELRLQKLAQLSQLIRGEDEPGGIVDLVGSFGPLQENVAERILVESLPDFLSQLNALDPADRDEVRALLQKITRGQTLDLERFGGATQVRALATAAELDEYTYLVAGCVGQFWTRLCFQHLRNFSRLSQEEMLALGKTYGMGLQLVNILRDVGSDLRAGRCYFPVAELAAVVLKPEQIVQQPERFLPVYAKWLDKAATGLSAGRQYSLAVRNHRVRAATALPALIGRRTLALLRDGGATILHRTIKVPRSEVRALIAQLAITLASRRVIEKMFREPSR